MRGWNNNKIGRMEDENSRRRQKLRDRVIKAVVVVSCVFDNQGGVARNSIIFGLF